jgi:DNA-binding LytR/AlgR family response regulator
MNVLIIDDDKTAVNILVKKLKRIQDISVIETANSGKDGLEIVKKSNQDIIFLDIEMPDMSGMKVLDEVKMLNRKVVIYTSHDQYMLSSFRKEAYDFLMKPIDDDELEGIIERFLSDMKENPNVRMGVDIRPNTIDDKFLLYTNTTDFQLVQVKDIGLFVYNSERRIWKVIVAGRENGVAMKRSVNRNMILSLDKHFIQVSQSYIININYLIEVVDNTCYFYPPFDKINYVPIGRFFRQKLIEKLSKL